MLRAELTKNVNRRSPWNNTKELWNKDEILFIATDERNKTFFDPIKKHHNVRFLDDYFEMAKLGDMDPYYLGMVDTIVASHGRVFAGTFFSTVSLFCCCFAAAAAAAVLTY